jgi:simple sugar transport system ATP-binding protein
MTALHEVQSPGRSPELRLEQIVKHFGSVHALDGANLVVPSGTVHALLGENGAGKTTLMRAAFGMLQPDAGRVLVDARDARFTTPADAIRAGIGMVHQHFTNVGAMTVAENVALGGGGLYSPRRAAEQVAELVSQTGLAADPSARVDGLSVAAQQRLEILKAIARRARVLILDEPTAVLAPQEAQELLRWLRAFADTGGSVILITHKLAEALSAADDVTVLRRGKAVLTARAAASSADELANAMLGESPHISRVASPRATGDVVLRLSSVSARASEGIERISDVDLELREHEILGVAALENSGHGTLLRVAAGRVAPSKGTLFRKGSTALIPEDRQRDSLILGFSLTENVALRGAATRRGRMNWSAMHVTTERLVEEYDVRAPAIDAPVKALSGGNQQKLVLARELSDNPSLVVAENPTRGLDIRASSTVHDRLRDAAARGAGVILHSGDLDEVLALATRLIVVYRGRVTAVPNERNLVGRAMLGLK